MNKWIILVTGPVIFGACSIKRKAENTQTASASVIALEERSYRYRDSMAAALNRSLAIERNWMVELQLPEAGRRIRYEERIRLGETAQSASSTLQGEVASIGRGEQTEQHEYRTVDNVAEAKGVGWKWWPVAVIIGAGAWMVWRLIRVWPFK